MLSEDGASSDGSEFCFKDRLLMRNVPNGLTGEMVPVGGNGGHVRDEPSMPLPAPPLPPSPKAGTRVGSVVELEDVLASWGRLGHEWEKQRMENQQALYNVFGAIETEMAANNVRKAEGITPTPYGGNFNEGVVKLGCMCERILTLSPPLRRPFRRTLAHTLLTQLHVLLPPSYPLPASAATDLLCAIVASIFVATPALDGSPPQLLAFLAKISNIAQQSLAAKPLSRAGNSLLYWSKQLAEN
eukprot:TRINITY_DN7804_c1_g1_i1.p1 TRINITY_DN7804_c1_g1~~TRINITY_DN7804_c1_g1_i1.p1  ORF type:complete len:250 (+),score=48.04 TRINITY_DN7804_c1_g1_i1:24-752(+)